MPNRTGALGIERVVVVGAVAWVMDPPVSMARRPSPWGLPTPAGPLAPRHSLVFPGRPSAAVRDRAAGVAPLDRRVEALLLGELLEPVALRRVPRDAVEERREQLRAGEPHVVERLVDHQ